MSAYDPDYKPPSSKESNELTKNDLKKMADYIARTRDPKYITAWREKYMEKGKPKILENKKSAKELEAMRAQQFKD